MKNEVIIEKFHRYGYDPAVREGEFGVQALACLLCAGRQQAKACTPNSRGNESKEIIDTPFRSPLE